MRPSSYFKMIGTTQSIVVVVVDVVVDSATEIFLGSFV